ncbi:MAG TPA: GntR family transcriptional regulator [Capsulimonadaceae bacterium]
MATAVQPITRRSKRTTVTERVESEILSRIRNGQYQPGSLLPGWRSLAVEYGVGPVAIAQGVKKLVAEGILRSENGRGTFVADVSAIEGASDSTEARIVSFISQDLSSQSPWIEKLTRRRTIGVLNTNEAISFGSMTILRSVEKSLSLAGGSVLYANLVSQGQGVLSVDNALESLMNRGAEAIVVVAYHDTSPRTDEYEEVLGGASVPLIYVTPFSANRPVWNVYYDSFDAAFQATSHLIDNGCSSFAYLAYEHNYWSDERLAGMQAALRRSGVSNEKCRVRFDDPSTLDAFHIDAARQSAHVVFAEGVPEGIVAVNDHTARGVMMAAAELGLTPGVDFQLIGFDDFEDARTSDLSSMRPPLDEMGQCAARLAVRALEGDPTRQRICLTSHLIARSSTNGTYPRKEITNS